MRVLMLVALALGGCGFGDATLDEVDPEAAPMTPTYSSHVAAIMDRRCTACHSAGAQFGEKEGYGYETCEKVKRNWRTIVQTGMEDLSMPPGGAERMASWEILTLQRWWAQGATCD